MLIDTHISSLQHFSLLSPEKAREAVTTKYFLDPDTNARLQPIVNGDDPAEHYLLEFTPPVVPAVVLGKLKLVDLRANGRISVRDNGVVYEFGEYFDLTPLSKNRILKRVLLRLPWPN
jgi:hypothetical protein